MNNLQTRALSAIVLAAAVLWLTWLGGLPFRLLVILGAALVYYEWVSMAGLRISRGAVGGIALAVVAAMLASGAATNALAVAFLVGIGVTLAVGWGLGREMSAAAALAYAGLAAISLALLRGDDGAGLKAILFLFAIVWATDIAAYFTGKTFGGPKLAPKISPGKTWSGAIGGTVAGVAAGVATAAAAGSGAVGLAAAAAFMLAVVAQAGDLFESAVKRHFGVKDSSHVIPGHGGLMDRVDGLVAAGFALYLIGVALGGVDQPSHGFFNP
ncbi:MAG: phosphatidate cytidylyltransferase [Hyphomicrobiales bacterium]|nr:phosphatidate cytidylyltransferase [Hyphomicrobiales bacterium]